MSEVQETTGPEFNAARGRPDRAEFKRGERRRRRAGTLTRMAAMRLDVFDPGMLDTENYVYRWVNDEDGKIRMATKMDDYDKVAISELEGFDRDTTDSEGDGVVRMLAGKDKGGNPIYTYLLRKPKWMWQEDMEQAVRFREEMMEGVVHRGESIDPQSIGLDKAPKEVLEAAGLKGAAPTADPHTYVPKGNQIGSAAARKRGPITRSTS